VSFKLKLEVPKPNLKWWNSSRKELLKIVEEHHKENWAQAEDPVTGKKWKPRKEPTGKHPLLKKTGKMFGTTKFKADGGHPMIFKATTNVAYGKFHQEGTSRMPQRRWLGLGENFEDKFAKAIKPHLFKGKITMKAGY
jgi:phage gpG-like protein